MPSLLIRGTMHAQFAEGLHFSAFHYYYSPGMLFVFQPAHPPTFHKDAHTDCSYESSTYYAVIQISQINKLRRVLVAFSWYDTSIGYCQGLNRLAAIALLFLDEEHAFWCLVTIIHHHLPRDYYDRSLLGSQADQVLVLHIDLIYATNVIYRSVFSRTYSRRGPLH